MKPNVPLCFLLCLMGLYSAAASLEHVRLCDNEQRGCLLGYLCLSCPSFSSLVSHLSGVDSPWPLPHSLCRVSEWDLSLSPFPLPFVLFLGSEGILSPLADREPLFAGLCAGKFLLKSQCRAGIQKLPKNK